jgi:hypothetical protein
MTERVQRAIRGCYPARALDPAGISNPGVVLPAAGQD